MLEKKSAETQKSKLSNKDKTRQDKLKIRPLFKKPKTQTYESMTQILANTMPSGLRVAMVYYS